MIVETSEGPGLAPHPSSSAPAMGSLLGWGRPVIQIHVMRDEIGATLRRGGQDGKVIWTARQAANGDGVQHALATLLREAPRTRWGLRPRVTIAVDAHAARVKRLRELPNVPSTRMLESVVRENAHRFFLWDTPFVTTRLRRLGPGEAIGGVVSGPMLDAARTACAETGYVLHTVYPTADPELTVHPRTPAATSPSTVPRPRAILAVIVCAVALCAAVFAPGVAAERTARRAAHELAALAQTRRRVTGAEDEVQRTRTALTLVTDFERHRRSVTWLLAALAAALPPKSAVTDIRADTTDVDLVVVSERAAAVLSVLDRIPGVAGPEIIGPISREAFGPGELERATIRFRYDPSLAAAAPRITYAARRERSE